jgi:hypothetical protein
MTKVESSSKEGKNDMIPSDHMMPSANMCVRWSTYVPFRRFLGDVCLEFMQRLYAALHDNLRSYLRDALHEGSVDVVVCLSNPLD